MVNDDARNGLMGGHAGHTDVSTHARAQTRRDVLDTDGQGTIGKDGSADG
jgi:hypothetical protein